MDPNANKKEQQELLAKKAKQGGKLDAHDTARLRELKAALADWQRKGGFAHTGQHESTTTARRLKPLVEVDDPSKIKVKNPGVLEVPEGKFLETGKDHFVQIAKKLGGKGHSEVSHALSNLVRWNQGKGGEHDRIAKHAEQMIGAVHAHFEKADKPEKEEAMERDADVLAEVAAEIAVTQAAGLLDEAAMKKFIAKAIKKPGSLRAHFGLGADAPVPVARAKSEQAKLHRRAEQLKANGQKLPEKDRKLLRRLNLFLRVLKPAAKAKAASATESVNELDRADQLLQEIRSVLGA